MSFLVEQSPENLKARATFIAQSELSAIRMVEFSAERTQRPPAGGQLSLEMSHRTEEGPAEEGRQVFHVRIAVRATAEPEGETVFEVKTHFEAEYTLAAGYAPVEEQLQAFMEGNAVFHCWPFFREFVQSATQRMGLMAPPMPMLVLAPRAVKKPVKRARKAKQGR